MKEKIIIGRTARIKIPEEGLAGVPAKIDTGADSSSIWASNVYITEDGVLHYTLFDHGSPYYTGRTHSTCQFIAIIVRSSNGTAQVRYSVKVQIVIKGKKFRGTFTLADRSKNQFPVLIGCRALKGRFLVDASLGKKLIGELRVVGKRGLAEELKQNPKAFFEKYHLSNPKGDISE